MASGSMVDSTKTVTIYTFNRTLTDITDDRDSLITRNSILKIKHCSKIRVKYQFKRLFLTPLPREVCGGNIFPCKLKTGLNLEFCFHIFEFYIIVLQASALEVQCLKMKYCYFQSE